MAIRPVAASDAPALADLYRENRDFLAPLEPLRPDSFFTVPGQRRHLEQLVELRAAGAAHAFVILLGEEPVGTISLSHVARGAFQSASAGYWVARAHNGRGIATRALGLVVGRAFGELGLHRVEAATLLHNTASQRVIEKNGFRRIGIASRYLQIAGVWSDHVLFQRTVEDGAPPARD